MEDTERDKLLFSVPEAAAALGLGKSKVWELLADGRLRGVKIDSSRKLTRAELERFVASLEDQGPPEDPAAMSARVAELERLTGRLRAEVDRLSAELARLSAEVASRNMAT